MDEHKSLRTRTSYRRTVCEVWRELYDIVEEHPELRDRVEPLLDEGYGMSKRMNAKLLEYSAGGNPMGWKRNPNWEASAKKRRGR